ncbi:acyl carrier protein [Actinomadura flavalba]|uniref:acyl carrier protein n=1 Tax=Actinomadura flavalba TaxID=1120938 RepID=UPI000382D4F7|nr:acyl carrier protein [Actinomadura flavalba]
MTTDVESLARTRLAEVAEGVAPDALDPDAEMAYEYGLTSLKKVMLVTALCAETGVDLGSFTEDDLARLNTLRDLVDVLTHHLPQGA